MPDVLGSAWIAIRPETSGFESALTNGLAGPLGKAEGMFGGLTGKVAGSFALVGVGFAATAVKMAADFQSVTTQIITGAGESASNIDLIRQGLLKMAGEVGVGPGELAKGLYNVESAGFHGSAALDILRASAEGAKVGMADQAVVADALTTALNDYHLPASAAVSVTNDLVTTVSLGKTHMADLAGAMGSILPVASALGVPLDEVSAAMATMTVQGTDANRSATSLRFLMSALAGPTAAAAKELKGLGLGEAEIPGITSQVSSELKKLGLHTSEVAATLAGPNGLQKALNMITDAIGKQFPVGSAQYEAALKNAVGGTRGMTAALELTGASAKTFQDNLDTIDTKVKQAGGSVAGWALVQEDFNQKLDQAKGAVSALLIEIGTKMLPIVTTALTGFMSFGSYISDHVVPALKETATWVSDHVLPIFKDLSNWFVYEVMPAAVKLWDQFENNLLPSLKHLWQWISDNLLPIVKDLAMWFADHVAPVLGDLAANLIPAVLLVLGPMVTVLGALVTSAKDFAGWVGDHWQALLPVFALVALAVAPIAAAFVAAQVQAVTSSALAGAAWVFWSIQSAASWAATQVAMVAGWVTTTASATVESVATSAQWIASSVASAASWLATQVAMIAGWVATTASALLQSVTSSALWVAASDTTAGSWLATKVAMIAGWVLTAAAAVTNAVASSATWILQAGLAGAAWLATKVAMIAGWLLTVAASVTQALLTSAPWILQAGLVAGAWVTAKLGMLVSFGEMVAGAVAAEIPMAAAFTAMLGPVGILAGAIAGATVGLKWLIDNRASLTVPTGGHWWDVGIKPPGWKPPASDPNYSMPGHASGGAIGFGETGWVGERGKELATLTNSGLVITPHAQSMAIADIASRRAAGTAPAVVNQSNIFNLQGADPSVMPQVQSLILQNNRALVLAMRAR